MGPDRSCPGKGRLLEQTSAKAHGNGGVFCGLAEAFSQDSTGGSVLAVQGLGASCGFCCQLWSRLGFRSTFHPCWKGTNDAGSAGRQRSCCWGRACLAPQEEAGAAQPALSHGILPTTTPLKPGRNRVLSAVEMVCGGGGQNWLPSNT